MEKNNQNLETKEPLVLPAKASYLYAAKRNQLALLTTRTSVTLTREMQAALGATRVEKVHTRFVLLNANYLKLENERRKKEGLEPLAKAGKLPFGEWAIEGVLIHRAPQADGDSEKFYLRYYPYADSDIDERKYYFDNVFIPEGRQMIKDLCPSRKNKPKPVCCAVCWDNIEELELCDKEGDPDVRIV